MWRLIIWFLIAAGLAWGVTWLASHPGTISIEWFGWRIEDMPVALALAVLLVGILVMWIVFRLLRWLIGAPFAFADMLRGRRRRKAQEAVTTGVTALLAGDAAQARKAAQKAARLAPADPLARLVQAQTALAAGELQAARFHFDSLKDEPQAEPAALRGLYDIALREGDAQAALAVAEQALRRYPTLPWAAEAVLRGAALAGDWPRVRALLTKMRKNKLIDKAEERRLLAVAHAAEAQALEESAPDSALQAALQAHKLDPSLVPAALVAARLLAARGKLRKATKVLEQTWQRTPHPDIAEVYAHLRSGDSPADRLVRVRQLLHKAHGGEEGAVALARAAIDAQDWDTALEALRPRLEDNPSARIFLLLAELEETRSGDIGRVREWLSRARRARPGPAWVADGIVSPQWLPVTPDGTLGAFRWQDVPASTTAQALAEPVPREWLEGPARGPVEPAQDDGPKMVEAKVRDADEEPGQDDKSDASGASETSGESSAKPEKADKPTQDKSAETRQATDKVEMKRAENQPLPADKKIAERAAPPAGVSSAASAAPDAPPPPPRGAEAVAELPEEDISRPPLPDDPGPLPKKA